MKKQSLKPYAPILCGIVAGILYGTLVRFAFARPELQKFLGLMTFGFIFLVPFVLGIQVVYFAELERKTSWLFRIFMPWVPCLFLLTAAFLTGWEGSICIFMALPIFMIFSSIGGAFMGLAFETDGVSHTKGAPLLIVCAILPLVCSSIEQQFPLPQTFRTVDTQITINAPSAVIWHNIERVPAIQPQEHKPSLFHWLGFPRPVEATLSHEGIGGVRHATFEGKVLFVETITTWEREKKLAFTIKADTASIPPTTLDEHVTVGGPFFDVLDGTYWLEPVGHNQVILHLSSKHRLSTRFNFYAGWWTDAIMRDIQNNILGIIKNRCEQK